MQRCTWHLKHNAAEWTAERYPQAEDEGQRRGLMAAVHVIVDAPGLNQRQESLAVLRQAHRWLANRLDRGLSRIPPAGAAYPVRTNNLMERGASRGRQLQSPLDAQGERGRQRP